MSIGSIADNGIQWVVQKDDEMKRSGLKNACKNLGVDYVEVDLVPFTNEIPSFPTEKKSIFYGSTTFRELLYADNRAGLFFNSNFYIENYLNHWGSSMLNHGSKITTFKDLMAMEFEPEKILFIRPNDDTKSFTGVAKSFKDIGEWYKSLKVFSNTNLDMDTKIIVGEPYNIQTEWRLWIVNKKVVASSQYREYFTLREKEGCPDEVIKFAESRCSEYTPHDVFVMDIGLCGDEHYIIECGCMNAAGFYKANVQEIVKSVTEYLKSN